MFIKKSFIDEITSEMERHLVEGAINKQAEAQAKLVKAADYLNAAAEIFDESGLDLQSEALTVVLESLAAKKNKKKNKKKVKKPIAKKPAKKELSSDEMIENLKGNGWVFDKSDSADGVDHSCVDDNCASCQDMAYVDDSPEPSKEEELYSMLEDFKRHTGDDFEDEWDQI